MTLERRITWLFRANAIINWTLSIRGIVDPIGMAAMFVVLTNWAWIPFILHYDLALRVVMRRSGTPSGSLPRLSGYASLGPSAAASGAGS